MTASGATPGTGKFSWKESVPAKLARKRAAKEGEEHEAAVAAAPNAPTPTAQGAEAPGWVGTGASNAPLATPPPPTISTSSTGQSVKAGTTGVGISGGAPLLAPSVRKIEPKPRMIPRAAIAPVLEPGEIPEEDLEAEPSPRRSRRRRSEESLTSETGNGGGGERRRPRPSLATSRSDTNAAAAGGGTGSHQCETCGKVYKHRNCLTKHGWEHHESWSLTKKWCQTKHQQVQMLEAAQVLVDMTTMHVEGRRVSMDSSLPK